MYRILSCADDCESPLFYVGHPIVHDNQLVLRIAQLVTKREAHFEKLLGSPVAVGCKISKDCHLLESRRKLEPLFEKCCVAGYKSAVAVDRNKKTQVGVDAPAAFLCSYYSIQGFEMH